jgi:hypothetical protein
MMGIFGRDSEQDDRLDATEPQLRRLTEQVGELSIDLGVTRMQLLEARIEVSKSVKEADLDPMFGALNDSLDETRTKVAESKAAADDAWSTLQDSSADAIATLRTGIDDACSRLDEA